MVPFVMVMQKYRFFLIFKKNQTNIFLKGSLSNFANCFTLKLNGVIKKIFMRLIIDIGNTLAKVALFEESMLVEQIYLPQLTVEVLQQFLKDKPKPESVILSSVRHNDNALIEYLSDHYLFLLFSSETPLPIKNRYGTPSSLGLDRLAAAVAAASLFPDRNVLIISVGTAITYD